MIWRATLLRMFLMASVVLILFQSHGFAQEVSDCGGQVEATTIDLAVFSENTRHLSKSEKVVLLSGPDTISTIEIRPDESFTAIVIGEVLYLGRDTPGMDRWGNYLDYGREGSHLVLENKLAWQGVKGQVLASGSILFAADGSIEISGYHSKIESLTDAQSIESLLKKILPYSRFRLTGGRLSKRL